MTNLVPLNNVQHKGVKIVSRSNFSDVANKNSMSLTAEEIAAAASSFPTVLIKDANTATFHCVALFGFEAGQNLFCIDGASRWEGLYIPMAIQRAPFSLGPDPEQDKTLMLYLDEGSEQISQHSGSALYEENGVETAFLKSVTKQMSDYFNAELVTQKFVSTLLEKDLVKEIELLIQFDSERTKRIKGLYTINEEKLNELDEETVVAFFKQNFFVPIYAMLNSITQLNRLFRLHNNVASEKILSLNMRAVGDDAE